MREKLKNVSFAVLRTLPLVVCIGFAIWYLTRGGDVSVESILARAPSNMWISVAFMVFLYAAKSLSVVFPITILHIVGGFLFPPMIAVMVNSLGTTVELIVPYWVGRVSGADYSQKFMKKHPKIAETVERLGKNSFSMSFFLRIIACLPGDAVSLYLGALKLPFQSYLLGSFLGNVPSIVCATLLGISVTDPTSPTFWLSLSLTVLISVFSFLFYYIWHKKKSGKGNKKNS